MKAASFIRERGAQTFCWSSLTQILLDGIFPSTLDAQQRDVLLSHSVKATFISQLFFGIAENGR